MRCSLLVIALAVTPACWSSTSPPPPANVVRAKPLSGALRIARIAPHVGTVSIETTVREGGSTPSRRVVRSETLEVSGLAVTKQLVTYVEATGEFAPLAGKSFVVASTGGAVVITPEGPSTSAEEDLVRKDHSSAGQPDSTMMMVTERDFTIGTPVRVPPPPYFPKETEVTLTLREVGDTTATFDTTIILEQRNFRLRGQGVQTVDRTTGVDRRVSMNVEMVMNGTTEHSTLEYEAHDE